MKKSDRFIGCVIAVSFCNASLFHVAQFFSRFSNDLQNDLSLVCLVVCGGCRLTSDFSEREFPKSDAIQTELDADEERDAANDLGFDTRDAANDTERDLRDAFDVAQDVSQDTSPDWVPPTDRAIRVLLIGDGDHFPQLVVDLIANMVFDTGWRRPEITALAPNGGSLTAHANSQATVDVIVQNDWDIVVLQDTWDRWVTVPNSVLSDVFALSSRTKMSPSTPSIAVMVPWIPFESQSMFATEPGLRTHIDQSLAEIVTFNRDEHPETIVFDVAGAFEVYGDQTPVPVVADEFTPLGQYMLALSVAAHLIERVTLGRTAAATLTVAESRAAQVAVDASTRFTIEGTPEGVVVQIPDTFVMQFNLRDAAADPVGWIGYDLIDVATYFNVDSTPLDFATTDAFPGATDDRGLNPTTTPYPLGATLPGFFVDQFNSGMWRIGDLNPARNYRLRFYGNHQTDDNGRERFTKITVNGSSQTYNASLNSDTVISFDTTPDEDGYIRITVEVDRDPPPMMTVFGNINVVIIEGL